MALHVLAVLFTYWSVSFNALVNYKTVTALADAEYVQVSGSGSSFLAAVPFAKTLRATWGGGGGFLLDGQTQHSGKLYSWEPVIQVVTSAEDTHTLSQGVPSSLQLTLPL